MTPGSYTDIAVHDQLVLPEITLRHILINVSSSWIGANGAPRRARKRSVAVDRQKLIKATGIQICNRQSCRLRQLPFHAERPLDRVRRMQPGIDLVNRRCTVRARRTTGRKNQWLIKTGEAGRIINDKFLLGDTVQ